MTNLRPVMIIKIHKQSKVTLRNIAFYALLLMFSFSYAQVGIGNTSPQATIDITASNQATPANNDGILIPRVDAFPLVNPTATQQGMLIYLTTAVGLNSKGFYHWDNPTTSWVRFSSIEKLNDLSDGKSDVDGSGDGSSVFIGINAGANDDSSDNRNNGFGFGALQTVSTGAQNTAMGYRALRFNQTGNFNIAIGHLALATGTMMNGNTAVGHQALYLNTANQNTAVGFHTLNANIGGSDNTAVGYDALTSNQIGADNTSIGHVTLQKNIAGSGNVALGNSALKELVGVPDISDPTDATLIVPSNDNTAIGKGAMELTVTSNDNTAVGSTAGYSLSGNSNVAVGHDAGRLVIGDENVLLGDDAGRALTGDSNVFIGEKAGRNVTGDSNVFIGHNAGFFTAANSTISSTLLINNSNGATPLIYGEFDNSVVRINGELQVAEPGGVSDGFAFPTMDGDPDQILVTDGAGQLTFEDQALSTFPLITTTFNTTSTAQTIAVPVGPNPWVRINFDNVTLNATGSAELVSGNQFVAQTPGFYRINASYHTSNSQANTEYFGIAVFKNGNVHQEYSTNHHNNATNPSQVARQISSVVQLVLNDTVEIHAQSSVAGAVIDKFAGKTYFTIERIR